MRQPCEHCPWRVGTDAWSIGRDHTFEVPPLHRDQMIDLATRQDAGLGEAKIMECHLNHRGGMVDSQQRVCVGFALKAGTANVDFRIELHTEAIRLDEFRCDAELHDDFAAMIAANPSRNAGC